MASSRHPADQAPQAHSPPRLWRIDLDQPTAVVSQLAGLLDADEVERAGRLLRAEDRNRFIVARAAMRCILAEAIGDAPEALRFVLNPWGKPELVQGGAFFNLSHSAHLGLFALWSGGPVGVDVESMRPLDRDVAALAFSPAERAALAALPASLWSDGFYRGWVRKEAVVKALGEGLAHPADGFDVTLAPGEPARLLRMAGEPDAWRRWRLEHLEPAPGFVGAFAARDCPAPCAIEAWTPPEDLLRRRGA